MIGWILLGAYVLGYLVFAPIMARALAAFMMVGDGERGDLIMASILAVFVALFWPLVIPVGWVFRRAFRVRPNHTDGRSER